MVKAIPDGYTAVTPYLTVKDASGLIEFMQQAFGATETVRMGEPGGPVMHAELQLGGSFIMCGDAGPENPPTLAGVVLYLPDVDSTFKNAVAAGAKAIRPPADMFYGDRQATVEDRWGNRWTLSTHIEDVSGEEMERRMAAMAPA